MTSKRRALAHAALALTGSVLGIIACSSDDRPAAGVGSGTSSSSSSSSSSGLTSSGSTGNVGGLDASDDGAIVDASSSGDTGTVPETPCVGDKPLTKDGGTLPSSCPGSATCSARCTKIAKNFRVGVAQMMIDCFTKLTSCDDTQGTIRCITNSIGVTCSDPAATTYCQPLASACDPNAGGPGSLISTDSCATFASALTADGRASFKSCIDGKISAGTCAQEVGDCFAAVE